MRLYDCKVLLGGSRDNEVRKADVTAAEIMILRAFHGPDSVIEITPKEMDKRVHAQERARLHRLYVGDLANAQKREEVLISLFGPTHVPLPVELPAAESFADEPEPAPKRATVPAKAGKAEDVAAAAALA